MSRQQDAIPILRGSRDATLPDIKPRTPIASLDRARWSQGERTFGIDQVGPLVGMASQFIRRVLGTTAAEISAADVVVLLDQDAFAETFVPRSRILDYLVAHHEPLGTSATPDVLADSPMVIEGEVTATLARMRPATVQCVVTSTPYWGLRIYKDSQPVSWADGETSVYGHEQTPEGFIRHTVQILHQLRPLLTPDASVWWNIMDSYNTRTQIRGNAAEALRAMRGEDKRGWHDHEARRYSAGHAFLADGEQCLIPSRIAERASRLGYHAKSIVTWAKDHNLPEPQNSRVSRALEYVLHLAPTRTPKFDKSAYRRLPPSLGGRNPLVETDKLSDVWKLPTAAGKDGHGAQFPLALPARCIALSYRHQRSRS